MRFLLALLAASAASAVFGQQFSPMSVNSTTNRVVVSDVVQEKAWRRDVVTTDQLGNIHGDGGVVARTAETSAINTVADESVVMANAANTAMTNAMSVLFASTNNMATSGIGIAIAFPPATDDINLRGFVVLTTYTNGVDTQWVWYNAALSLSPNRTVTYESNAGDVTKVKCVWDNWNAAGTNITVSGRTWTGVHKCTVNRPLWAQGKACLEIPNEVWGGENGMDWGDMTLIQTNAVAYYTGYVTNATAGVVAYFDNGFLKDITPIGE